MKGKFLVLEGPDGSGKTTQARLLVEALAARGTTVEHLRDPGGTPLGEEVRALLLRAGRVDPVAEMFLFGAARAQLAAERIAPALAAGRTVVCERWTPSTVVYQGRAAGLTGAALDALRAAVDLSAGGLVPDLVLVLDVDPASGLARKGGAAAGDRIEARGEEFQRRVRDGYLAEARSGPRCVLVPAGSEAATAASVREAALRALAS